MQSPPTPRPMYHRGRHNQEVVLVECGCARQHSVSTTAYVVRPRRRTLCYDVYMGKPITVRVEDDLVERIDRLAAKREWTRSHWVSNALERVVRAEEQKDEKEARR